MPQGNTMLRTWARGSDFAVSLAASTVTLIDLFGDYKGEKGINEVRGTVSAFYGEITVLPTLAVNATTVIRGAVAIGVLDKATNAATAPNPTSVSFPWLWKWEYHIHPTGGEITAGVFRFHPIYKTVEIRSQRKMRFNEDLFAVFSNLAGATVVMTIAGNILLKE